MYGLCTKTIKNFTKVKETVSKGKNIAWSLYWKKK